MEYKWNIKGIYQLIESDSQTLLAGKDLTSPSNMGIYIVIGLNVWFSNAMFDYQSVWRF